MANRSTIAFSFRYSPDDKKRIRNVFEQAGAPKDTDWRRVHLKIAQIAGLARRKAQSDKPTYAGDASRQVARLVKELDRAATSYEGLRGELQAIIEHEHDLTFEGEPLLVCSLLPAERPALKKVLRGERVVLLLKAVAKSAARVRDQLQTAGTPSESSSSLPSNLPRDVRDAVKKTVQAKHRPWLSNRFPATGMPKVEAVRWAVRELWPVFETATGKKPTVYPTSYKGKEAYDGGFYHFVKAVLGPMRISDEKTLGSKIHAAYQERNKVLRPSTRNIRTPRR